MHDTPAIICAARLPGEHLFSLSSNSSIIFAVAGGLGMDFLAHDHPLDGIRAFMVAGAGRLLPAQIAPLTEDQKEDFMRFQRILACILSSAIMLIGLIVSVHAQQDTQDYDVYLPIIFHPTWVYFPVVFHSDPTPTPTPIPSLDVREEVLIPAGPFQMGCDNNNPTEPCRPDERPLHTVNLDAYYIDKYEVTTARYKACVDAGRCRTPRTRTSETRPFYYGNPTYADYPVLHVSWSDAGRFCAWEGKRLPTEAEWEKAARGSSDTRKYPWGDSPLNCALGNFDVVVGSARVPCIGDTARVGLYPGGASPYGVMDMAGNVREWVNDWYAIDYYRESPANNPQGPATGTTRVLRGGSWGNHFDYMRVARRVTRDPLRSNQHYGFRCVRSP